MKLPPDPDNENDNRALWAEKALLAFREITGTDKSDAVCDLLCDIMHWCDRLKGRERQHFVDQLKRALDHYGAETDYKGTQHLGAVITCHRRAA